MCTLLTIIQFAYKTMKVAIGSPLRPVFSGTFMVELENSLVPALNKSMKCWRRFVNETVMSVKIS